MQKIDLKGHSLAPREVEFSGGTGVLNGFLFLPPGDGPFPCIVDNHGSATPPGTTDLSHPQTATLFLSWGCAYLFPHRAGYGNSPGVTLGEEVPAPRGTEAHDEQMSARLVRENQDVISALDYVTGLEEIDPARIVVMGSSLGGIHTLLALAADPRWRCGVDFSGGASQWAKHPKIKRMLLDAASTLTKPVCLIQPENDFNTAPTTEISFLLQKRDHPYEAKVFPPWGNAGPEAHRFCATGQQIWGPLVYAFFERYL